MKDRHGVTPAEANEALADPDRVVFDPDYASQSGQSVRTIGYSPSAECLLVVITIEKDGVVYGASG